MVRSNRILSSVLCGMLFIGLLGCQVILKREKIEQPSAKPAEVKPVISPFITPELKIKTIESKRELPIGYWTQARSGDFLLQNKEIKVIVSNFERNPNFGFTAGNIIDIARTDDNLDYFGEIYFNGIEYKFDRAEIIKPDEEKVEATLRLSGSAINNPGLQIIQDYILKPEENFLKLATTLVNQTTETLNLKLGDKVFWGGAMVFAGRRGSPSPATKTETESEWIGGRASNYTIALVVDKDMMQASHQHNISEITYKQISLTPQTQITLERYLFVGDKDVARATDFMIDIRKEPKGFITGTVVDARDQKPVADVEVRIRCNRIGNQQLPAYPYTLTFSKEDGSFEAAVQPGSYFVLAYPFGRTAAKNALSIEVPPGGTHVVKLPVSPEIKLTYEIVDATTSEPLPAKLTFISLPNKPVLDLGATYSAPGSSNTYYAYTGRGELTLPPELFKIIVSRGIEYETVEKEVRIVPGAKNELKVALKRVLDTTGWICADIGVKTNNSPDSLVAPKDRVIAAVCEGVEWLVTGDANVATDLQQVITELGLNKWIKATPGINLEFDPPSAPGNFLIFPADQKTVETIVPKLEEIARWQPNKIFEYLRKTFPNALIQVNRPLAADDGYFAVNGYDKEKKELPTNAEFSYDFDLLNIWQGKSMQAMEECLQLYYNLLSNGYRKGFSGGSFARFIYGEETGYPRTYIMSSTDDPDRINIAELCQNLKLGKTIVTNGPFIKFTVNQQSIGSLVKPLEEQVTCTLDVFAAPWINVGIINLNRNGNFVKWIFIPPIQEIHRYPRQAREPFKLPAKEEAYLDVTVKGTRSMEPVISPISFPEGTPMMPFAICGPILIDINGNGNFDPTKTKE